MRNSLLVLVVVVAAYAPVEKTHGFTNTPKSCSELLSNEILDARKTYRLKSGRSWARLWNQAGNESQKIGELLAEVPENGHAVYFSAGLDIFRFMADFPMAKHFHLVDSSLIFLENAKSEISARLRILAPDTTIEVLNAGYSKFLSPQLLAQYRDRESVRFGELAIDPKIGILLPMIYRVRWTSLTLGAQEKLVYFHPFTYSSPATIHPKHGVQFDPALPFNLGNFDRGQFSRGEIQLFLSSIPETEPFLGAIQIGGSPLLAKDIDLVFNRLIPKGIFVSQRRLVDVYPPEFKWIAALDEAHHLRKSKYAQVFELDPFLKDEDEGQPVESVVILSVKK